MIRRNWLGIAVLMAVAGVARGETKAVVALEQPAPAISAATVDGTAFDLASYKGSPVVVQFGSISEPVFRLRVPVVEKLAAKYGSKAAFVIIYQHEAHAADGADALEINSTDGFAVTQPQSQDERIKLAKQAIERLGIKSEKLFVDGWNNATSLRYGDYPNMTFVIDGAGKVQAGYAWMDPKAVQIVVDALLAGKPVPPEFRGRTKPSDGGPLDYTSAALDMTGRAGPGAMAVTLDRLDLTDAQKKTLLPALGQFMADLRNFRETRQKNLQPATGVGAQGAGENADALEKDLENLRASADKLQETAKSTLNAEQFQKFMAALDVGPAKRLMSK